MWMPFFGSSEAQRLHRAARRRIAAPRVGRIGRSFLQRTGRSGSEV